jgi:pimeloyl-ACP methyl ester carboxylesterase
MNLNHALDQWQAHARPGELRNPRYRLRYFDWGQGEPFVFIHGLNDRAISFAMVIAHLAPRYRCIAYELANGRDDHASTGRYRHADYADDLISLLDHLQLKQVHLFGSSFGSTITLDAIHRYPERFRTGMLQGGFARRPLTFGERCLARVGRLMPGTMKQMPMREKMLQTVDLPGFVGAPDEVWKFYLSNSEVTPNRVIARRALLLHKVDLRPKLPEIRQPLLMIGGDNDLLVPKRFEEEVLHAVPAAKRIEFEKCGHYPQYTHPERTAREVEEFVKGS